MDAHVVVRALRSRHERSAQPSSKLLVATIDAVNETLEAGKVDKTIVAYFGACMSPLERVSLADDPETGAALCVLLAAVMSHTPGSYIRSKFSIVSGIVCKAVKELTQHGDAAAQKAALHCLVQALKHMDVSSTWAPVKEPFLLLVRATLSANAKVRRAAADGLAEVFASNAGSAAQAPASAELVSGAQSLLHPSGASHLSNRAAYISVIGSSSVSQLLQLLVC